jgi:cytochrome c biogenesis protein CcdA
VLAPCVLPILPVILSSTLQDTENKKKSYIIIVSLAFSIAIFTLALKTTTLFIQVPGSFWKYMSGGIILFF